MRITRKNRSDKYYFRSPCARIHWGLLAMTLALSACIYVPVVDESNADSSSCKTFTKSMSMQTVELQGNLAISGCQNRDCVATALASVVVVTAGSAVISGSIVLTGNTIHWLEYQGTCSEGYLSRAKKLFLESIGISKPAGTAEPRSS
jgi:broad specificity polyphosphatase/5'/3'-nucleotidase SurE